MHFTRQAGKRPMAAFHAKPDSASIFVFKGASDLVLNANNRGKMPLPPYIVNYEG